MVTNPNITTSPDVLQHMPPTKSETLSSVKQKSTVNVARLTIGYVFNKTWDVRLSYSENGSTKVNLQLPSRLYLSYTPLITLVATPYPAFAATVRSYSRNILSYDSSAFTLLPSYIYSVGKFRLRAGAGLCLSQTSTHFETTAATVTIQDFGDGKNIFESPPTAPVSSRYAKKSGSNLGWIVSLGIDYKFTEKFSAGLNGNYTTFNLALPSSPWSAPTHSTVSAESFGAELSLTWYL